jgi:alpha-tubulin suppressor-like RCC1 family protein
VRTDGTLSCWGYWQWKEPTPAGKFLAVSAGGRHTCGLRIDGTVTCFGNNDAGQSTAPPGIFLSVSAGYNHTCGVQLDGTVACWGSAVAPPGGLFSSVSAGAYHSCGTRPDGAVVCWGESGWGAETPPAWLQ